MDGEPNQRGWPDTDDRKFYIQRGIPIIPTLTFLCAIGLQTVLGIRYISGLESEVRSQGKGQIELSAKVDKLEGKVDAIGLTVQQGSVPAALNQRAITDLERQITRLEARVEEGERRQSGETMRGRMKDR